MAAPYAEIVADIKRRIADGRLRPGDRVPSTRQLARDRGVALATAAKALALLAQEGVVVAEPRVGTVVAEPRGGRPAARRPDISGNEMTRERIVRAAVEIADAEGLPELTMRRVADRLGMATMSLYRHVGGKDDLVLLMISAVIDEFPLPEEPPDGWRARLEVSARLQWAGYRAHPWMAGVTSLTRPTPSAGLLRHTEWVMAALAGTRLDATAKMHVHTLLYSYVQGIAANLELERQAQAATGLSAEEFMAGQEEHLRWIAESGDYRAFAGVVAELDGDFDLDLDRLFEFGLGPLLDGLAKVIG
ncbi:TetR/AcrR family transcriptional regulator C-terminal domain-containing protein [Nonomuraea angiospora]|uniref:TetR/AcrR family transcriptional regulator C-terminal domain-containing protein n=1 Tax=Nonomuraea angiospora TaxID=46172 RepID=UPI0029BF5EC1|nr:GntR family transcriptional regulator [Nonomuraea angiospora]MDX3101372.1 TetR/AcrR family transcriptional regulator C-terminal domain-containing protein [Nonomuraea angiospora]